MMKKAFVAVSLLLALLSVTGCTASNQTYYEQAQLFLGGGDYTSAADLFCRLGEYRDSADYALYAAGLHAIKDGDYALAQANLTQVDPFKSSGRYLRYLEARMLEDTGRFDEAQAIYESLGSFEDSPRRVNELTAAIPERHLANAQALMDAGDHEQALELLRTLDGYGSSAQLINDCLNAISRKAYNAAKALYARGDYAEALTAFEALGETLDAAKQAERCRDAIYTELEKRYAEVTMATAAALIEDYAALDEYRDSPARVEALTARYIRTVALMQQERPFVTFGQYPAGESGMIAPLTWRVLSIKGTEAVLLCENVIDALPAASPVALTFTEAEQAAVRSVSLPTLGDLAGLTAQDMIAPASPYAMAQGVRHHSNGNAWWWLGNSVGSSRNAIVWYNGNVIASGVHTAETVVGVRPLLTLSLEDYAFTQGDGSKEHPYQ